MDWRSVNAIAKLLVGCILILILICSCKTRSQVITVPGDVRTDTVYKSLLRTDSVMIYDSIHVRETPDTVYMEKWRNKLIIRKEHDTIYHHTVCAKKGFIDGICSHIPWNSYYLAPGLTGAYQYQYEDISYKQFGKCIHATPVHRAASHDLLRTSPCSR